MLPLLLWLSVKTFCIVQSDNITTHKWRIVNLFSNSLQRSMAHGHRQDSKQNYLVWEYISKLITSQVNAINNTTATNKFVNKLIQMKEATFVNIIHLFHFPFISWGFMLRVKLNWGTDSIKQTRCTIRLVGQLWARDKYRRRRRWMCTHNFTE